VILKSTSHAVYEAKYHLVWCPKYRKRILVEGIRERVKELFYEIAERYDFARTVGEQITDDVIRKYIEKHSFSSDQLKFGI